MTWHLGERKIRELISSGDLQLVAADRLAADDFVRQAENHLASARAIIATDPEGSFQLAYDAARKALSALLENQGLRPTTKGGHYAVLEAARAQLVPPLSNQIKDFDWMRRTRNLTTYRSDRGPGATSSEAADALEAAAEIVAIPARVLDQMDPFR